MEERPRNPQLPLRQNLAQFLGVPVEEHRRLEGLTPARREGTRKAVAKQGARRYIGICERK